MMIIVNRAVVPVAIGAVYATFILVQIHHADAIDVPARKAEGGSDDAGLAVHIAHITGEGGVYCKLAVGTHLTAYCGGMLEVVVGC